MAHKNGNTVEVKLSNKTAIIFKDFYPENRPWQTFKGVEASVRKNME